MKWALMIAIRNVSPFMFAVHTREEGEALMDLLASPTCPAFFKGKTMDNVSFIVRTADIASMHTMDLDSIKDAQQKANQSRILGNGSGYQPLR